MSVKLLFCFHSYFIFFLANLPSVLFGTVGWASERASGLKNLSDEVLAWLYLSGARCK